MAKNNKISTQINKNMKDYCEKRIQEFNTLNKDEINYLALFFEHQMMLMSAELQTLEHIENQKEQMLESDDTTDEELEFKFQELSSYLQEQLGNFSKVQEDFDVFFKSKASKKLLDFVKEFINDENNEIVLQTTDDNGKKTTH